MKKLTLSDRFIIAAKEKGYFADTEGRVFRWDGKEVKGSKLKTSDHLRITLFCSRINERGHASVLKHRFIAYYYFGDEIFNHQVVRHLNDIGDDNRLINLKLGSLKDNRADIPKEKLRAASLKNKDAFIERTRKLTDEQIRQIRMDREMTGEPYYKLAPKYGITAMTAWRAINGVSWEDIE